MPEILLWVIAGLIGAAVGSFLNVCIVRLPEGESIVRPASRCPRCELPIRPRDNLPVLSWLLLRGRCRSCRGRISIQYPLVESTTALLWIAAVGRFGISWQALSSAVFFSLLLAISLTDARTYTIPDELSLGGLVIGLALAFAPGGISPVRAVAGAALGFGLLWLVAVVGERVLRKPAMGGGDIKMLAMMGAFLGPGGVLLSLFLGALFGTVIFGPISLRTGKLVPFGVFLALGAAVVEPWGHILAEWYLHRVLGV